MLNVLIDYANSGGRWPGHTGLSPRLLGSVAILALAGSDLAGHPPSGRAASGLLSVSAGAAQAADPRAGGCSGFDCAMDSAGPGAVVAATEWRYRSHLERQPSRGSARQPAFSARIV